MGVDGPVFALLKRPDLALALNDEANSHRLDAPSRQTPANFVPQKGGDLVAYQAVQHPARLLRLHQVHIDIHRQLERPLDGVGRNLVEHQADEAHAALLLVLEFLLEVEADGLAFAVRVSRQVHDVGLLRRGLQFAE